MGWFQLDNGDLLGDMPADTIAWSLKQHRENGGDAPSFPELLRGVELVLQGNESTYLTEVGTRPFPIGRIAIRGQAIPEISAANLPAGLVDTLTQCLLGVVSGYEIGPGRRPTLSEVLESFVFAMPTGKTDLLRDDSHLGLKKGDVTELR